MEGNPLMLLETPRCSHPLGKENFRLRWALQQQDAAADQDPCRCFQEYTPPVLRGRIRLQAAARPRRRGRLGYHVRRLDDGAGRTVQGGEIRRRHRPKGRRRCCVWLVCS